MKTKIRNNLLATRLLIGLLLSTLLTVTSQYSHAEISTVQSVPSQKNLFPGKSVWIQLRWKIATENVASASLSSTQIVIRAGSVAGPVVHTINKSLTRPAPVGISTQYINERVRIPMSVSYRVRKMGYAKLVVARTFTDPDNSMPGYLTANFTGAKGAGFSISGVKLRIQDYTSGYTVPRDAPITAIATVSHTGSGMLYGVWEVAETGKNTAPGKPTYRTIGIVNQYSATGELTLFSPALPQTGNQYLLRFRIIRPAALDTAVIRYSPALVRNNRLQQ